jgi:hypothetical protein
MMQSTKHNYLDNSNLFEFYKNAMQDAKMTGSHYWVLKDKIQLNPKNLV